jgi:hypothetical protein
MPASYSGTAARRVREGHEQDALVFAGGEEAKEERLVVVKFRFGCAVYEPELCRVTVTAWITPAAH